MFSLNIAIIMTTIHITINATALTTRTISTAIQNHGYKVRE